MKNAHGKTVLQLIFHSLKGRFREAANSFYFEMNISKRKMLKFGIFAANKDQKIDIFGRT